MGKFGRLGASVGRLGIGGWALKTGVGCVFWVCGSVCGPPGASFGHLGVGCVLWVCWECVWAPRRQLWAPGRWCCGARRWCGCVRGASALVLGAWAPSLSAVLSRGVSGLKPIVNYRLLYIDVKHQILAFKYNWNHIIWSYVAQVIPVLVHRGHAEKLTKTHGRLGIKVERLGAHFLTSKAQNQRLGVTVYAEKCR
ncbi:hypothetical protein PIB30_056139 [Stylosanthes scabra]|uniref:Uncharacterized protein n=1 Tax=Stylosanthes scabra TaxID=79078 RepID=A0ABU6UI20_9FABA|nr:hypothetical protein [Stylosanthes scabra]